MKKVVSIKGKLTVHATGGFNFSDKNEIRKLRDMGLAKYIRPTNNLKMHKREFRKIETGEDVGEWGFVYIIDSPSIRHAIFSDTMPQMYPEAVRSPRFLYNLISSPSVIARGYMFTTEKVSFFQGNSLKLKSGVIISPAIAEMDPTTNINLVPNTRSGFKKTQNESMNDADIEDEREDAKDTSLRFTELVPELDYTASFGINMRDIEFISCDDKSSNRAIGFSSEDNKAIELKDMYFKALKRNFNVENVPNEIKPYYLTSDSAGEYACEEGFLLTEEMRVIIVKQILHSMIESINTQARPSSGTQLRFKRMDMEIFYDDGTSNVLSDVNKETIDALEISPKSFYTIADEEMLKEREAAVKSMLKQKKASSKKTKMESVNTDEDGE